MSSGDSALLLALPDPCLLAVLQCCAADDQRSLFSAARAHSKLHQAAVLALRSLTAVNAQQQHADSMLLYLSKHHKHIDSVQLVGSVQLVSSVQLMGRAWLGIVLEPLPPNLQLRSLQLDWVHLQLKPGDGFQGVLAAATLKQLRLSDCRVSNVGAEALSHLPDGLEHLSIERLCVSGQPGQPEYFHLPTGLLQRLQSLTHLDLVCLKLQRPVQVANALEPLQALTGLVHLRLVSLKGTVCEDGDIITASLMSGMHLLTCLDLSVFKVEPGVLAGKIQLQHLSYMSCSISGGAAGASQLLSHLQLMQQLTVLGLPYSLEAVEEGNPPAAAYSALTASSKLQELDLTSTRLPAGAWQHMFPAGKQLPHLCKLDISWPMQPLAAQAGDDAPRSAPEGSRLVSCCPSLQALYMQELPCSTELLTALQGLSGLHTLHILYCDSSDESSEEVLHRVCQLTGLREFNWESGDVTSRDGLLLQLTQLKQLTSLMRGVLVMMLN